MSTQGPPPSRGGWYGWSSEALIAISRSAKPHNNNSKATYCLAEVFITLFVFNDHPGWYRTASKIKCEGIVIDLPLERSGDQLGDRTTEWKCGPFQACRNVELDLLVICWRDDVCLIVGAKRNRKQQSTHSPESWFGQQSSFACSTNMIYNPLQLSNHSLTLYVYDVIAWHTSAYVTY